MKKNNLIGSHVSCKDPNYLVDSLKETINNNANCMMVFVGPPLSNRRQKIENMKPWYNTHIW